MDKIFANDAQHIMQAALANFGMSEQHKEDVIRGVLQPSLRGIDSHGLRLFETYLLELQGGRANPTPNFKIDQQYSSAVKFDADGALGVVAGFEAVRYGMNVADETGVAMVSVSNSNHYGAASNYALMAAEQGFLCLSLSNADALVAPFGGVTPIFGTNPLSFAAPAADGFNYCLDMATSQVSLSKILQHFGSGAPIESSWAIDIDTEQQKVAALKPLGGYKGQGLAMMVSILAGLLAQTPKDSELSHLYAEPYDTPRKVGHCFILCKINAFMPLLDFQQRLSCLIADVRASASLTEDSVIVAGDKETAAELVRREQGIPLIPSAYQFFVALGQSVGYPLPK